MAVVDISSQLITDLEASPVVKTNPTEVGGVIRETVGTKQTNSDDSINSVIRLVRVPSRARVTEVLLDADGASTAGAADIGLYDEADGAVVDADFFASAQSIATAIAHTDVTYESGVIAVENRGKRLYEQLGETTDPNKMYDVALTLTAAVDAASDVTLKVRYILDE